MRHAKPDARVAARNERRWLESMHRGKVMLEFVPELIEMPLVPPPATSRKVL